MTQHAIQASSDISDEYVTIIAPSFRAVMDQFRARGLSRLGFAITGPVARHRFAYAGSDRGADSAEMFGGVAMVAATFRRSANVH